MKMSIFFRSIIILIALTIGFTVNAKAQQKNGPPPKMQPVSGVEKEKKEDLKQKHTIGKYKQVKPVNPPHHNYKHLPAWGSILHELPSKTAIVTIQKHKLNYCDGLFYRVNGTDFVVVKPSLGMRVKTLPPRPRKIMINEKKYYYYYGVFYAPVEGGEEFEVVSPIAGARVDGLPEGYQIKNVDGIDFYHSDGARYVAVEENGEVLYEVVEVGRIPTEN